MLGFKLIAIILFGAAVNIDADNIQDTGDNLPPTLTLGRYFQSIGGWLELYYLPATWYDARLRCQLKGGALASPADSALREAMTAMLSAPAAADRVRDLGGAFTGVHATISKGDFFSLEGVPLEDMQLRWWANEPDNRHNNEDCLVMTTSGEMADVECNSTRPYLCLTKGSKNEEIDECGKKNNGYQWQVELNRCYKLHGLANGWARAFKTCAAERAHLALVRNRAEADAVRDLYGDSTAETCSFIGFRDWTGSGDWQTIKGEPMEAIEAWNSSKVTRESPWFFGGCGGFYHSSARRYGEPATNYFMAVECDSTCSFVCEKMPVRLGWFL